MVNADDRTRIKFLKELLVFCYVNFKESAGFAVFPTRADVWSGRSNDGPQNK